MHLIIHDLCQVQYFSLHERIASIGSLLDQAALFVFIINIDFLTSSTVISSTGLTLCFNHNILFHRFFSFNSCSLQFFHDFHLSTNYIFGCPLRLFIQKLTKTFLWHITYFFQTTDASHPLFPFHFLIFLLFFFSCIAFAIFLLALFLYFKHTALDFSLLSYLHFL